MTTIPVAPAESTFTDAGTDPGLLPHLWRHEAKHCASNDWLRLQQELRTQAERLHLHIDILGLSEEQPILLLTPIATQTGVPNLLLASGFHGEEPAGPWGLLQWLESCEPALWQRANISLLPLVNVAGFQRGHRFNHLGENPNRGFFSVKSVVDGAVDGGPAISAEGAVLSAHGARLSALSRDGVLSAHEDVDMACGYVYAYNSGTAPDTLGRAVVRCNASFFALAEDGLVDDCPIASGIVFNQYDGSFESWLMRLGATRALCTETPGLQPFAQRVAANAAMMACFIEQSIAQWETQVMQRFAREQ